VVLWRIGSILLVIGLAVLSPLDDIILYAVLVPIVGLEIIPLMTGIGLVLTIVGASLIGVHLLPLLTNPLVLLMFIISLGVIVYLLFHYNLIALDVMVIPFI